MSYTQEEIEKSVQIHREFEAHFWKHCEASVRIAATRLAGDIYTNKIIVSGSWEYTIWGFERGFIGNAVVEFDNSKKLGFIKRIAFYSELRDGLQKEFTYAE